jgi:CheY-like chemotaxis protein
MAFQALLVSKDDAAIAVLTPVLAEFGLGVQGCNYPEALCLLGEQQFDAVIVDF